MRRYLGFELGKFSIVNNVVLEQNGIKVCFTVMSLTNP